MLLPLTSPKSRQFPLSEATRRPLEALKIDPGLKRERILGDDEAVGTLSTYIVAKERARQRDRDLADAYYNRAIAGVRPRT